VKLVEIRNFHTLAMVQPAEILQNRVLIEENTTYSLKESSSPFFLQEFRPLNSLKATYRFTSLTIMRVMKIMCNREPPKV
jgi:hypothetical protein